MADIREELHKRKEEFQEKYADVINDLATKYEKPVDVGYDILCGIARAEIEGIEPLYETEIDFDKATLVEEYKEIERLSKIINGDIVE